MREEYSIFHVRGMAWNIKNRRQEKMEICLIQKKETNLVIKSTGFFRVYRKYLS